MLARMQRVILVLPRHAEVAPALLHAASLAADRLGGARILVLGIAIPPILSIEPGEEILTLVREDALRRHEIQQLSVLRQGYDAWSATDAHAHEWVEREAPPDETVAEWGSRADLIVLGQPQDPTSRRLVHTALFDTERPVLVLPPGPPAPFGSHIAISWHDDPRCAAAILGAMPILAAAAQIDVLVNEPCPSLPAELVEHGIAGQVHELDRHEGPLAAAVLATATRLGADMLVAGAFWHSELRESLFGGVTHDLLAQAKLPLFLRH